MSTSTNTPVSHSEVHAALTLANVAEVVAGVIQRIAGNDLSTAVGGNTLTRESLQSMALSVTADKLAKRQAA